MRTSSRLTGAVLAAAVLLAGAVLGIAVGIAAPAPAAAATATPRGTYVPVGAKTVLDTRTGAAKNHKGAIKANKAVKFQITGRVGIPKKGVAAVLLRLTAVNPARNGSLTAYKAGLKSPKVATLQFGKGRQSTGLAYVPLSSTGRIVITNHSAAAVQVTAVVAGYYRSGTANTPGSVLPVTPKRLTSAAVKKNATVSVQAAGKAGVPKSAGAVIGVLSAVSPAQSGSASAGGSVLRFAAHRSASSLVVAPLSTSGKVALHNGSAATTRLVFDVVGYVTSGAPVRAGGTGIVPVSTITTRTLKAHGTTTITVTGHGGLPSTKVRSLSAMLTISGVRKSGSVLAYKYRGTSRASAVAQVYKGTTVGTLVTVPLAADGKVVIANKTAGKLKVSLAAVGYTLSSALPTPRVSRSHYIRTTASLTGLGRSDAKAGSTLVVLHVGAQLNDRTGVQYSATFTDYRYAALVSQLQGYLDGFGARKATVAIATNNEGDWGKYPAAARGRDWADQVLDKLHGGSGVTVVGASDIEPGFASTASQALAWQTAYLAAAGRKQLVFVGSADGCPTTLTSNAKCNYGWTLSQLNQLAGGKDARIRALPQIYVAAQATQWANIDRYGGRKIHFLGALTQHSAQARDSWTPQQAYPALWSALSAVRAPSLPAAVTDLGITG